MTHPGLDLQHLNGLLRDAGYIDEHAQSMKVYDDNYVRFAKRVNFDIGCQMDFSNYPIDKQKCPVKLESFGYTAEVTISLSRNSENVHTNGFCCCRRCSWNGASTRPL